MFKLAINFLFEALVAFSFLFLEIKMLLRFNLGPGNEDTSIVFFRFMSTFG